MSIDQLTSMRSLLSAIDRKAASLAADLHPAWIDAAWARLGPQAARNAARLPLRRHSALLAQVYDVRWPALTAFREPAHRLALLDRAGLVKVLAACALDGRRDSVRRSVGRVVRELLIEGIGESAYEKVLQGPAPLMQAAEPLIPLDADPERLAVEGFRVLCSQAAWRHPMLITIVRLSLPPAAQGGESHLDGRPSGATQRMVDRLHEYFPELAWLFGSDMDRALSVSPTGSSGPPTSLH